MELNIGHASDQHSVLLHTHVHDVEYLFFLMGLIFIMADAYHTLCSKNCEKYIRITLVLYDI